MRCGSRSSTRQGSRLAPSPARSDGQRLRFGWPLSVAGSSLVGGREHSRQRWPSCGVCGPRRRWFGFWRGGTTRRTRRLPVGSTRPGSSGHGERRARSRAFRSRTRRCRRHRKARRCRVGSGHEEEPGRASRCTNCGDGYHGRFSGEVCEPALRLHGSHRRTIGMVIHHQRLTTSRKCCQFVEIRVLDGAVAVGPVAMQHRTNAVLRVSEDQIAVPRRSQRTSQPHSSSLHRAARATMGRSARSRRSSKYKAPDGSRQASANAAVVRRPLVTSEDSPS